MKKIIFFILFVSACFNKSSMNNQNLEKELLKVKNKYELNIPLNSKDFNYIFIYLDSIEAYALKTINTSDIADFILYSNERDLLKKYIITYKKFKNNKNLRAGMEKIHKAKPRLVDYFINNY